MKTAEEWSAQSGTYRQYYDGGNNSVCIPKISKEAARAIQQDAYAQAVRDAADAEVPAYPNHIQRQEIESAFDDGVAAYKKAVLELLKRKE